MTREQHRLRRWGPGAAIVLLTLLVYLPSTQCGFIWDDDAYVQNNPHLRSADGLGRIWFQIHATPQYYPLVFTSYWIEHSIWGLNPAGFHGVNIALHAAVSLLLWRVLRRLAVPAAWTAAAVFALHPVHVESVTWITERKNVLSGVFYLGALLAYLRYAGIKSIGCRSGRSSRWYAAALLLFLGALLSKTVTCSLPAVILILLWWKRARLVRSDVLALLPFFLFGIAFGLLTAWYEKKYVGAVGVHWQLTHIDRWLIAGRALWFYAGKLLWPHPLSFIYPRWSISASSWWQFLFPLAVVAAIGLLWLGRRRMGTGPLAAVLCFCGTLVPALGFFDIYPMRYSFVADHFQYLASIGLIVLFVAAAARFIATLQQPRLGAAAAACVLVAAALVTWQQQSTYANLETLWRNVIRTNPRASIAYNNLGNLHRKQGREDEAFQHFRRALQINPNSEDAHNNLGAMLYNRGRLDEAVEHYRRALQINPNHEDAHTNLGVALASQGRVDEAVTCFRLALRINPRFVLAHNNLGIALRSQGRIDEAVRHHHLAIRIEPDFAEAYSDLGIALAFRGSLDDAIAHFRRALQIEPDDGETHFNLGLALASRGSLDDAIAHFRRALQIEPDLGEAHFNLGIALASRGRLDDAVAHYRRALQINPSHSRAHNNLGTVLASKGRLDEAVAHYREALRINPSHARTHNNLGIAYGKKGEYDKAVAEFTEAIRLNPKFAEAYRNRAVAHESNGEQAKAAADFATAKRIGYSPE